MEIVKEEGQKEEAEIVKEVEIVEVEVVVEERMWTVMAELEPEKLHISTYFVMYMDNQPTSSPFQQALQHSLRYRFDLVH